jgi:hypothetical protein
MWERVCHFFRRHTEPEDPLIEFEEGLLLIVDAEQLANNLRSKLRRSIGAEDTIVYLADVRETVRGFTPVGEQRQETQEQGSALRTSESLPGISANSRLVDWFRVNREILLLDQSSAVLEYLHDDLGPFVSYGMDLVLPLLSMERLIGLVFLRLGRKALSTTQRVSLQLLGKQAGLAFENPPLQGTAASERADVSRRAVGHDGAVCRRDCA